MDTGITKTSILVGWVTVATQEVADALQHFNHTTAVLFRRRGVRVTRWCGWADGIAGRRYRLAIREHARAVKDLRRHEERLKDLAQ